VIELVIAIEVGIEIEIVNFVIVIVDFVEPVELVGLVEIALIETFVVGEYTIY